ncbi:unnamed protein product, partial [marine sediment metagenome]
SSKYLIPTLSCLGLNAVLLVELSKLWPRRARQVAVALTLILVIFLAQRVVFQVNWCRTELPKKRKEQLAVHREANQRFAEALKVYYFRSSSKEYALCFGNSLAGDYFGDTLRDLYPDTYFYNCWRKVYHQFGQEVRLEDIAAHSREVVFQGVPFERPEARGRPPNEVPPGTVLELVSPGKHEVIYRLKAIQADPSARGTIVEDPRPSKAEKNESAQ